MPIPAGTDFPEQIKRDARRLAAYKCCYCRDDMGDDVHHLVPKAEGGQGVLENAILLCVRCHHLYGEHKEKRAQLRDARDTWYEIVREKYSSADLDTLTTALANVATKDDIRQLETVFTKFAASIVARMESGAITIQDATHMASTLVTTVVVPPRMPYADTPLALRMAIAPSSITIVEPILPLPDQSPGTPSEST